MTAKDKKIIDGNPGKSPYELKELGLSDATFESLLMGEDPQDPPTPPKKEHVKVTRDSNGGNVKASSVEKVGPAKPALSSVRQHSDGNASGTVNVRNKVTGKVVTIGAFFAKKLLKTPNIYEIIQ